MRHRKTMTPIGFLRVLSTISSTSNMLRQPDNCACAAASPRLPSLPAFAAPHMPRLPRSIKVTCCKCCAALRRRKRQECKQNSGLLFFSTPKCLFLDRTIGPSCFRPACLFFDFQLFFSPTMRPRKRAQSFFSTSMHYFEQCFFLISAGETHTQGEIKSKSQTRNEVN